METTYFLASGLLSIARQNHQQFRDDFIEWLRHNAHVWQAFEREANRIWDRGRRHYSARTIGEYLRHESAVREDGDQHGLKLNDHAWPDLSRLYMLVHPDRFGFFELRDLPRKIKPVLHIAQALDTPDHLRNIFKAITGREAQ
jgi:hypothetical protein